MKHYAYEKQFKMKDKDGNKYTLEIMHDDFPDDPRTWENVSTMICWHSKYCLGDEHNYDGVDELFEDLLHKVCGMELDDLYSLTTAEKRKLIDESDKICIKELNLYDHSGITISTSCGYPYNDRWDSGCVGCIYVTKEIAMKELVKYVLDENGEKVKVEHKHEGCPSTWSYKVEPLTDDTWKARAEEIIENEVKTYDQYLQGDVYGYALYKEVLEQEKCPHCGEVIRENLIDDEVDSCWDFYGNCLEENGIVENLGDLEFVD